MHYLPFLFLPATACLHFFFSSVSRLSLLFFLPFWFVNRFMLYFTLCSQRRLPNNQMRLNKKNVKILSDMDAGRLQLLVVFHLRTWRQEKETVLRGLHCFTDEPMTVTCLISKHAKLQEWQQLVIIPSCGRLIPAFFTVPFPGGFKSSAGTVE